MNDPLVRVSKAKKTFEGGLVTALDEVSLEIEAGSFVAITGPSGSGKTTLLNIVGAMDVPDSGEVFIDGELVASGKELDSIRARKIGFVFQMHNLIPVLTARQNVEIPMLPRPLTSAERRTRALQLLDEVKLEKRAESSVLGLSGGERQRVAIARALMNDPELVFCDEPTGNLDTSTGDLIHDLILELNRELGTGFILVTHDQGLASLATRILTMRDGRFEDEQAPA